MNGTLNNVTNSSEFFCEFFNRFGTAQLVSVVAYSIIFVIALFGNSLMFLILTVNIKKRVSRVYTLLLHLCTADLIVTLWYMPKEIAHNCTASWDGPAWLCPIGKFMDVFGVYLSSNVLICMSLDRFFSIIFPFYSMNAKRKVNQMLIVAWLITTLSSMPQLFLYQTAQPPSCPSFHQCVSSAFIGAVPAYYDLLNTALNFMEVYVFPFTVIVVCYTSIFCRIIGDEKTRSEALSGGKLTRDNTSASSSKHCSVVARRSNNRQMQRAKSKTLRMTAIIVSLFFLCWTPYFVSAALHFADVDFNTGLRRNQIAIDELMISFMFIFAVLNSSLNPYVYGMFSFDLKKELREIFNHHRRKRKCGRQVLETTCATINRSPTCDRVSRPIRSSDRSFSRGCSGAAMEDFSSIPLVGERRVKVKMNGNGNDKNKGDSCATLGGRYLSVSHKHQKTSKKC